MQVASRSWKTVTLASCCRRFHFQTMQVEKPILCSHILTANSTFNLCFAAAHFISEPVCINFIWLSSATCQEDRDERERERERERCGACRGCENLTLKLPKAVEQGELELTERVLVLCMWRPAPPSPPPRVCNP